MSKLLEKLLKNTTIKQSDILDDSKFFEDRKEITFDVPILNIAFSGSLKGGYKAGITMWAGPSRHFKSLFSLLQAKMFVKQYLDDDYAVLFYDSEFGTPKSYFKSFGFDPKKVIHCPIPNLEDLKFDIMQQLDAFDRKDKVIILIDSIGNLASKKEVDDALDGKSVADMSRAKQLKSLFRMITPKLVMMDIPLIVVNHIYMEMGAMYPKAILSGGSGGLLSSDTVFILGRQQSKDGTELDGYNFVINVEKSRQVREKSKFIIQVKFKGGIEKYSGLLEIALASGHVIKPSNGWYSKVDMETGEIEEKKYREKQTYSKEFWQSVLDCPKFEEYINKTYRLESGSLIEEDTVDDVYEETEE